MLQVIYPMHMPCKNKNFKSSLIAQEYINYFNILSCLENKYYIKIASLQIWLSIIKKNQNDFIEI
jgi:hypothetical protein